MLNEDNFVDYAALVGSKPYLVGMNRKVGAGLVEHGSHTTSVSVAPVVEFLARVLGSITLGLESTRVSQWLPL